jgi:hypothetical protein
VVSAATAAAAMSRASIIATRPSPAAVAIVPSRTIVNRFCMKNTGRSMVCWSPESCRSRSARRCWRAICSGDVSSARNTDSLTTRPTPARAAAAITASSCASCWLVCRVSRNSRSTPSSAASTVSG